MARSSESELSVRRSELLLVVVGEELRSAPRSLVMRLYWLGGCCCCCCWA